MYHKIHKTTAMIVLVMVMALFISACGSAESEPVEKEEEQGTGEQGTSERGTEEQRKNMLGPMQSMIYAHLDAALDEEITPHWEDDEAVWQPVDDLINDWGETYAEESDDIEVDGEHSILVSGDFLKECVSALYADFDGIYPDIPESLTTSGYGISAKEGDEFRFSTNPWGEQNWTCEILTQYENPDGTATAVVGKYSEYNKLLGTYKFELVDNAYTQDQEDPDFAYSISSMVKIDNSDVDDDSYILPESDSRYYSEEELMEEFGSEGEGGSYYISGISNARFEIYARHGRIFYTYIQPFFDGSSWYQATVKPADFNDDVLNEYEKENIHTILSLEDLAGDPSVTDSEELFKASWQVIQDYGFHAAESFMQMEDEEQSFSDLGFHIYLDNIEDMGDYYFIQAEFEKPIYVPTNLKEGDQYTVSMDESGEDTRVLTCIGHEGEGENESALLVEGDGDYPDYLCAYNGKDEMTELSYYDGAGGPRIPFYGGELRVHKDANTGNILGQHYYTVNEAVLIEEYGYYDEVAFDENGYVTELLYVRE